MFCSQFLVQLLFGMFGICNSSLLGFTLCRWTHSSQSFKESQYLHLQDQGSISLLMLLHPKDKGIQWSLKHLQLVTQRQCTIPETLRSTAAITTKIAYLMSFLICTNHGWMVSTFFLILEILESTYSLQAYSPKHFFSSFPQSLLRNDQMSTKQDLTTSFQIISHSAFMVIFNKQCYICQKRLPQKVCGMDYIQEVMCVCILNV